MAKRSAKKPRGLNKRRKREIYIALGILAAIVVIFAVLAQIG
jgi:hypothetical protein